MYPVANDTVLTLTDILDRDTIDVDVLRNVFLADGPVSSLTVALLPGYDADAEVTPGRRIRVKVGNQSQVIPFQVSRPTDSAVAAYAFVWVPGYDDALPQLNRKARALTVPSESALTIDLNDYVVAIGGKKVRLADTSGVRATHSNGQDPVVDDHTLRFTSADKYFGPASVSFQVTDGTSATDPNGRIATLVLPIKVTPRENQPPVFGGGVIDFEPGETKVLDLLKLTTYPYPKDLDELAYSVVGQPPAGFSYTLSAQKLTLHANNDASEEHHEHHRARCARRHRGGQVRQHPTGDRALDQAAGQARRRRGRHAARPDDRRGCARQRRRHESVPRAEPQGGVDSGDRR